MIYFFSNIVGLKHHESSEIYAACVCSILDLHRLFSALDRLFYLHGVTTFTEHQPHDHAARLTRFALAASAAARRILSDATARGLRAAGAQLRIGLHCGAVFGAVVGERSGKYTLVGEAVNVAARMEQACLPGQIQCSAAMARAIAEQSDGLLLRPR